MPRIEVCVRLRPDALDDEKRRLDRLTIEQDTNLSFQVGETYHAFQADNIFGESSSQSSIYDGCCAKIVESSLDGYHGCIFAYGQTGAGKTFTMSGQLESADSQQYGICGQAIIDMFRRARRASSTSTTDSYSFKLSVLEVYNEVLYDLLSDNASLMEMPSTAFNSTMTHNNNDRLSIIETADSGVMVPNLKVMPISSAQEAINLLMEAHANRAISSHDLNRYSSRSHLIYSFYITRTSTNTKASNKIAEPVVWQSKLHFVDLAGSERQQKTKSTGTVQKEANYINKSLTYLEQVVVALSQANREHIPYRQSKLTYLLKDSLGGNCLTLLLACIWPRSEHAWETLSTMRFASRMKNIELNPVRNKLSIGSNGINNNNNQTRSLQVQIDQLRRELALRDIIHHRNETWLPELSIKQKVSTCQTCLAYTTTTHITTSAYQLLEINSISQFNLLLSIFRGALKTACEGDEAKIEHSFQTAIVELEILDETQIATIFPPTEQAQEDDSTAINNKDNEDSKAEQQIQEEAEVKQDDESSPSNIADNSLAASVPAVIIDEEAERQQREQKLRQFTSSGAGKQLQQSYEDTLEALKAAKARQREIVTLINERKEEIDRLGLLLQQEKESFIETEDTVVDIGESAAIEDIKRQMDSAKAIYRLAYQELKLCKEQIEDMQGLKQRAMAAVLAAFNKSLAI